jgi:CheY-like chemotaxis protein
LIGETRRSRGLATPEDENLHAILVVEDEVLVRFTIVEYLRECGFQVVEAGSADEALAILSEVAVDIVFSDVQMPGTMSGFGLARWIRQHRPGVKVILTSGRVDKTAAASELCNVGPLISKPYDPQLVVERINGVLGIVERPRTTGTR